MNDNLSISIPESAEKQITSAEAAYGQANAMTVSNQAEYDTAGAFINDLKKYKSGLEKERKEITGPIDQAKKKVMAKFRPHIDAIEMAIKSINAKMIAHYQAEEKKRIEAEAKAAEKARKAEEKALAKAEKLESEGKHEKAAAEREKATMNTPMPVLDGPDKQTANTTIVTTWRAVVYDKLSLIKAVAAGEASMELLDANMPALNKMAQANKDMLKLPGVKAKSESNVRSK